MRKVFQRLWKESDGQGLPEYALLVGAVVVLALTLLLAFAPPITRLITGVGDQMVMPDAPDASGAPAARPAAPWGGPAAAPAGGTPTRTVR